MCFIHTFLQHDSLVQKPLQAIKSRLFVFVLTVLTCLWINFKTINLQTTITPFLFLMSIISRHDSPTCVLKFKLHAVCR